MKTTNSRITFLAYAFFSVLFVCCNVFAETSLTNSLIDSKSKIITLSQNLKGLSRGSFLRRRGNFEGVWYGRMGRIGADCGGFPSTLAFRHVVSLSGNAVRISTNHDGVLTGISRDKGRRLEASRSYYVNNVRIDVALIYKNATSRSTIILFPVKLSGNRATCSAVYGVTARR